MEGTIRPQPAPWVVLKFGGTSVATAAGWRTIRATASRIREGGHRVLVVCSAVSGVSNRLEALIAAACDGTDPGPGVDALRSRHVELANELDIPLPPQVDHALDELRIGLEGIRLLREAPPRVRARLLALGELMSTRIGANWLGAAWTDARELLRAVDEPSAPEGRRYLSARVAPRPDPRVRGRMGDAPVVITQGFIASDVHRDTVLLGRGGSDTSASYLGVLLGAERVEIWTDVPGLFSANPRRVRSARHLEQLGYDEVAAMAALGARVLHPRCIEPVCEADVPLHVKSTYLPDEPGTAVGPASEGGIKAVTSRRGLALLRLCRPSRWQPVGFVADVSACFKRHGFSIDLMSTSPSTITVTVDPTAAPATELDALVRDLKEVSEVSLVRPVASVSLVGTGVRRAFDRVGEAFLGLRGVEVKMVTHGAADHHLTFVVDEDRAEPLVVQLHELLFPAVAIDRLSA